MLAISSWMAFDSCRVLGRFTLTGDCKQLQYNILYYLVYQIGLKGEIWNERIVRF